MPRQIGVHWTVWSVYISSYLYRDLLIDALYFRDPSDSHGISTMFLFLSLSPSLPLYPILSVSTLFPSHVPVSLTSRAYFDWGQTLGFHTIYNAALSNGIEYERGWNEHMLEKWRSNAERRTLAWNACKREIEEKDLKNQFHMYKPVCVCVYIYIIKSSRIRSIFWKINDRSYSMNNSFLPSPRANRANNCFVRRYTDIVEKFVSDQEKKWPVMCLTVRIYRSRKVTKVHTEPKLNCTRL